jgi:hypothetical protein
MGMIYTDKFTRNGRVKKTKAYKKRAREAKIRLVEVISDAVASGSNIPPVLISYANSIHKPKKRKKKFNFYRSREWLELRYQTLARYGAKCQLCGSDYKIHVDHIKPRSKFPHLSLDPDNLQILCEDCNLGKSNHSCEDWR